MTGFRCTFPAAALLLSLACVACDSDPGPVKPADPSSVVQAKKTPVGKNVFIEIDGQNGRRRVIVNSIVVLREGQLEGFLTRKGTKEHEYILAADCDARDIHKALLVARATPGTPVQFLAGGKMIPASGTTIKVSLEYSKNGKTITVPAQQWIRDAITRKALEHDWVFAGSRFIADPDDKDKPPFYDANSGDVICVCNILTAMLDLPIKSPKALEERVWEAFKDNIPPLNTNVRVILEPVPDKKAKNPPADNINPNILKD
jgi:hypothetical protein